MITTGSATVAAFVEAQQKKREEARIAELRKRAIRLNWKTLKAKGFGYSPFDRAGVPFSYENGRMLHEVMANRAWKGQRCFIIGGGPSLKGFDFSKLKNELVIGVNRAFEKIDCTINFAMDHSLFEWITKGELGQEAREKFDDFRGFTAWLDSAGYDYPKGMFILKRAGNQKIRYSIKDGIRGGNNSGFAALNLAVCLCANPIYLLGFDMKGSEGKEDWWHDGYPERGTDQVYRSFANDFNRIAPELKKKGFNIINLNRGSALKCFEFGKFKDIKTIRRPIITSYYTKKTEYEKQVEELKTTLRRFNLENDVVGIADRGSWHKNTYYKAQFIARMMKKYPDNPIVFVDADAKMRCNPVLFDDFDCDFACHFLNGKELLSGTLYFGNTKGSRYLVNKWIEENKMYPTTHMPQKNLGAVFKKYQDKINWKALPIEYCLIFDSSSRRNVNPVIEHFQLSRAHKESKGMSHKYRMKRDITGILQYCKGKRICVLGNADPILKKPKRIDSFDIVCRMNRGKPEGKEKYIGSRTDILFISTNMSGDSIKSLFKPKYVVWMTVCHRLASPWMLKNAIQNPKKDWQRLHKQLAINPTTGMLALQFILRRVEFKSLAIYGFDFFKTKSWYNTKIDDGKKHTGKKEEVLVMKMIKGRKNVRLL